MTTSIKSSPGRTFWSTDEENYLKDQYCQMKKNGEKINHSKLADLINKKFHSVSSIRTAHAVKTKSHVLGITTPTSTPTKKEEEKKSIKNIVGDEKDGHNQVDENDDDVNSEETGEYSSDESVYEEFEEEKPVKKETYETVSISNLDGKNSGPVKFEIQSLSKTTKTTTTSKRDVISSEMDYLKKRLDYLAEKLKRLDLDRKYLILSYI
ncbi:hypothetical protein ACTA71_003335 [Dictyostelium dimigraforme]